MVGILRELAQCVRMLAEHDEELNLNSQHHIKSGIGVCAYNSVIRLLLGQPVYPKCQTEVQWEPLSQGHKVEDSRRQHLNCSPALHVLSFIFMHACMHEHACTHVRACVHTHTRTQWNKTKQKNKLKSKRFIGGPKWNLLLGGVNHRETIRGEDKEDDAFSVRKWSSPLLTYTLNPLSVTQYSPRPKSIFCVSLLETGGKTVLAETREVKALSLQLLLSRSLN